jgi:hypothetical protein
VEERLVELYVRLRLQAVWAVLARAPGRRG